MRIRNILILLTILLVLGGYIYFSKAFQTTPESAPEVFVWNIEMDEIQHVEIQLPREGKSEAFIKIPKDNEFPWYFDDPQRSAVDMKRWGGGIPLLLSGPGAVRVLVKNATPEQLAEFGLTQPRMVITLTLENGDILNITIGDWTPNEQAFYVQVPGSNDVCTVDYTWYNEMERLVKEPPYVSPAAD